KRIIQLDGVRGIAILLVILWYYLICQLVVAPGSAASYAHRALSLTWSGVDLFFVLSGFLIAGILLDHRNSPEFFRIFYLRRVFRIFPLYFLLLGLFLCLAATPLAGSPSFQWLFHDPLPLWSYATFTQNLFMGARGDFGAHWLGITWSLAVEEQFYLFVPLLIYFLPRRVLAALLVGAILTAPLLRCVSPGFHAFVNTPWRADSLLSGALLAVLVRWHPFISTVRQHRNLLVALFGLLLLGAAVMTFRAAPFGVFNHLWLAALYSTFVLIAFLGDFPLFRQLLGSPVLVWFGQLSYGIYMFHQAVSGLLHGFFRHDLPRILTFSDAAITLAAFGITLALATLSYRFLESPLMRFAHRFQYPPQLQRAPALRESSKTVE
ncbi:MAG: acyltransferase, partial [Verrucomicrobiota bacterium]